MAWTYSGWVTQTTRATRITQLRAHIGEVAAAIHAKRGAASLSSDSTNLVDYHEQLITQLRLEDPDNSGSAIADSARATAAFTRGQPI